MESELGVVCITAMALVTGMAALLLIVGAILVNSVTENMRQVASDVTGSEYNSVDEIKAVADVLQVASRSIEVKEQQEPKHTDVVPRSYFPTNTACQMFTNSAGREAQGGAR